MDRAMQQLISSTKRVKAGNGQAAAARMGVFVQAYMAQRPQRPPCRGHTGDAYAYVDTDAPPHPSQSRTGVTAISRRRTTAMAHGAYRDCARHVYGELLAILPGEKQ
jgi:hypothetical protein